jgi:hypothetical protein
VQEKTAITISYKEHEQYNFKWMNEKINTFFFSFKPGHPLRPPGGFSRTIYDRYDSISDDEVKFTLQAKLNYFFQVHQQLDFQVVRHQSQIDEVQAALDHEKVSLVLKLNPRINIQNIHTQR